MRSRLALLACGLLAAGGLLPQASPGKPAPDPETVPGGTGRKPPVECVLTVANPVCKVGEVPELSVRIVNNTGRPVYLVGCLDGSDCFWRYPHCYFEIIGPDGGPVPFVVGRCGLMNPLRDKDFVRVPSGGQFDPFMHIDEHGFFGCYQQICRDTFRNPGEYRLRFVYSTRSRDIAKWQGDGKKGLAERFEEVPHGTYTSNEVRIKVVAE
jgi:hypothetical protein